MYNDLFQIGKITIHGYGLMIGIGFALAVIFGARFAKRRGLSEDAVYSFGLIAIITGFLGGKLLYILTEWKQFRLPDWKRVRALMRGRVVADGRNIYDHAELTDEGFVHLRIGK